MICLDTNILVRCITRDDPKQSPKALAFIKQAQERGEDLYIPDALVLESAWVLQKRYAYGREQVCDALEPLVTDPQLRFDHADRLSAALSLYRANNVSVHDAYALACCAEVPGSSMATFDKAIQALPFPSVQP